MAKFLTKESVQYPVRSSGVIVFNDENADGVTIDGVATHNLLLATLPAGALITAGALVVTTAWVGPTVATIDIGDNDIGGADPDRYTASPLDLKTTGVKAITPVAFKTTRGCKLTAQLINTVAAATAGQVSWWVEYSVDGRSHENIG